MVIESWSKLVLVAAFWFPRAIALMSRGVKELKRMIAEVREPGDAEAAAEPLANEQETLQSLQMKFEKLKLLSEADKEVKSCFRFFFF